MGASKRERMSLVSSSGRLDDRRFLLPSNEHIRRRLDTLHEFVLNLEKEEPAVIGATLWGSYSKGYADFLSDIDAIIYIDSDKIKDDDQLQKLKEKIRRSVILMGPMVGQGIFESVISIADITKFCRGADAANLFYLPHPKTGTENDDTVLFRLFHLGMGHGIYRFRERIIATLETMENGEEIWSKIMEELAHKENVGLDQVLFEKRRRLYPKTLAEGREYFLDHAPRKAPDSVLS